MPDTAQIALAKCASYDDPRLDAIIGDLLDNSGIKPSCSSHILVKPNLLMAKQLACTHPLVTTAVCKWLLDHNCHLQISDSPAFGSGRSVASAIGLTESLKKISLAVSNFGAIERVKLEMEGRTIRTGIAKSALECDMVFSVARVKAHSQMRMTLCVKNCFGTVCGARKAFLHALHGADRIFFAQLLAATWRALPPVAALADGIVAMHKTGPAKGEPFPLGLLAASQSAPLLDLAILDILHIDKNLVPLATLEPQENASATFPLLKPDDFEIREFIVPETLKSASFSPLQLARSCMKRLWKIIFPVRHS